MMDARIHNHLDPRAVARSIGGDARGNYVLAPGPGHSPDDRSLKVTIDPDAPDGFVAHSFAGDPWQVCRDHVAKLLGKPTWTANGAGEHNGKARSRFIAEYIYKQPDGTPYLKVLRTDPKGAFPQFHWTGTEWAKGKPLGPKIPYRLPEILAADTVFVVEGERDADNLSNLGLVATTSSEGAGKWTPDLNKWFKGRIVYVLPDNDQPGIDHARQVAANLSGVAAEVRVVALPGLPEKGDVSDWLDQGGDPARLIELCKAAQSADNRDHPEESATETASWSQPDLSILVDRRGELPPFPVDTMPSLADWLIRAADGAGATPGHVAVPLLSIASSLIGTARRVRASRSWSEPMTLWSGIVGYSGTAKTPGLNVSTKALSFIESSRRSQIGDMRRAHEARLEAAKAAQKKWKAEVQDAVDAGRRAPDMPVEATDPGPFVEPRLFVSDSTVERLAVLLQGRPRGLSLVGDELAGLFLNMGRYSGGSDREFWLQSWNGGSFVVERQGRPPVVLDHLLVGVTGGLQPDKLVKCFAGDQDGMYARLLIGWPEEAPYQPLSDDADEIEPEFLNALIRLVNLPAEDDDGNFVPKAIRLSSEALHDFEQFRQFLHSHKGAYEGREREWMAKGPGQVLRLAGTLTYLDWAMVGGPEPEQIQAQFMADAIRLWREYFWPHSRAALRLIGLSDRHVDARKVLRWIKANGLREVSVKDIRRDALSHRLDADQTQVLIDSLVEAGWLYEITTAPTGPGRPARRWSVNPQLFQRA